MKNPAKQLFLCYVISVLQVFFFLNEYLSWDLIVFSLSDSYCFLSIQAVLLVYFELRLYLLLQTPSHLIMFKYETLFSWLVGWYKHLGFFFLFSCFCCQFLCVDLLLCLNQMATKPLTTETIALTEKKMDMTLGILLNPRLLCFFYYLSLYSFSFIS